MMFLVSSAHSTRSVRGVGWWSMVMLAPRIHRPCAVGAISTGAPASTPTASPWRTPAATRPPATRRALSCTSPQLCRTGRSGSPVTIPCGLVRAFSYIVSVKRLTLRPPSRDPLREWYGPESEIARVRKLAFACRYPAVTASRAPNRLRMSPLAELATAGMSSKGSPRPTDRRTPFPQQRDQAGQVEAPLAAEEPAVDGVLEQRPDDLGGGMAYPMVSRMCCVCCGEMRVDAATNATVGVLLSPTCSAGSRVPGRRGWGRASGW